MTETELFESQRPRLRGVAYRMLGSLSEADDAVQEAWLRLERTDTSDVDNLAGWLTTVVARIALDMLRARESRREELVEERLPDPVIGSDPEQEALLADSVGLALLVVLETLTPAERLAFVLHDLFGVPFEHIAPIVDRSAAATRQLASRARRRVRGAAPEPDGDVVAQTKVVEAFMAAARAGDFDALVAVLDPDIRLRADTGTGVLRQLRGAAAVAASSLSFRQPGRTSHLAIVNGVPGVVAVKDGRTLAVLAFTIVDGRVAALDILADLERLDALPTGLEPGSAGRRGA
ncbi:MAG: hypothetical protein QOF76_731 [Solirubrobacteraceae bacterium]|jgi:RNA polymerase sigma-70 factor (ECF subfamily)|nr:hypothetical protein [Solirubrobacteraceae bacterium]